jgi:NADPH2:quinone reductase
VVIRLVSNYVLPPDRIREAVDHIEGLLERGALRPTIAARFPLAAIAQAHRAVEAGAIGKVVIDI